MKFFFFYFPCLLLFPYSQKEIYSEPRCRTPITTLPLAYETKFHTHTKDIYGYISTSLL